MLALVFVQLQVKSAENTQAMDIVAFLDDKIGRYARDSNSPYLKSWTKLRVGRAEKSSGTQQLVHDGKIVSGAGSSLSYQQGLDNKLKPRAKAQYACYIRMDAYSERDNMLIAGPGIHSKIFARPIGDRFLYVDVMSDAPRGPGFEKKIVGLIESAIAEYKP